VSTISLLLAEELPFATKPFSAPPALKIVKISATKAGANCQIGYERAFDCGAVKP
jgi:hypothetical protein